MNKILLFTCLIISSIFVLGQAPPNGFNYSAVARDANGNLVTDQAIYLRMSIIAGSSVGTTVYQEVHSSNTDDYGMFNLTIGTGAIMDGSFAGINWADNTYHLKIEMDITGGMNFTDMGTTQFLSVPYAMHAATADSVANQSFQALSINGDTISLTNGGSITLPSNNQAISISGDTIFLTNGGFVALPTSVTNAGAGTGPNAPLPAIATTSVSNITSYTALCGGDISHDGGTAITERGVCWNNSPEPTIDDNRTLDFGGGIGSFSINFSGLQLNTTYYVRAFAINNTGISYGNELSFTTTALNGAIGANLLPDNGYCSNDTISISSCNGQTSLSYNGHDYELVEIGGQCWFKENLQTYTYNNDTAISDSYYRYPGSYFSENVPTYGLLYKYNVASNQNYNVCPTGWHVPTDCEWMYLENTLGLTTTEQQQGNSDRGTNEGGMLKDINYWDAPNTWATNSSGFSALPAGQNENNAWFSSYFSERSYFWTSGDYWSRTLYNSSGSVGRSSFTSYYYSIRCLKD